MADDNPSDYRVFISHAGRDSAIANLISLLLRYEGVDFFLDIDSMQGGENIKERINAEIQRCDELLLLLTPNFMQNQYVWTEYGIATSLRKRTIVIYHELTIVDIVGEQGPGSLVSGDYMLNLLQIERYFSELTARIPK